MVQIDINYLGDLRCSATHVQSGNTLHTDAPRDNMGKGESFSPTDLLATALGACMLTVMGIAAQRKGIDLKGTTVKVIKEMAAQPVRRVATLTVTFDIPTAVSPENRQMLENAAHTCPVHKSLSTEVNVPVVFNWKG